MEQTNETTKFKIGRTYFCRSACDHDCVWTFKVVSRTEKSIAIIDDEGKKVSRRIKVWSGVETVLPMGSFSMAPGLSADRAVFGKAVA